jgi:hypothetical protein
MVAHIATADYAYPDRKALICVVSELGNWFCPRYQEQKQGLGNYIGIL